MTVWGIGAYLTSVPPKNVVRFFLNNAVAVIGHDLSKHPRLKKLRENVRPGDLIFIKSRYDYSKPLRIKGIGVVMNICALVNPCILSDFPLEQGFFISVIPQFVRRCYKHFRIGILNIKLFGVGELPRT